MKHLGTKTLESKRLILRAMRMEDAPTMYENWAKDEEVTKYLTWPPHESVEVSQSVLADWISQYENPDYYQWGITMKEQGDEVIGTIGGVGKDDCTQMITIGYCIGRNWWHQGIVSEALALVMQYLFKEVGMNRIEAMHDVLNPNSGKVMQSCGMKYEGTLRQGNYSNQGIGDYAMYAKLASDE